MCESPKSEDDSFAGIDGVITDDDAGVESSASGEKTIGMDQHLNKPQYISMRGSLTILYKR